MRVLQNLAGLPDFHHAAFVDDRDLVANLLGNSKRMGNDHHGHAHFAVDVAQKVEHLRGRARIKRARGLIAQHHFRIVRQRAGNGNTLLLAAGKLAGIILRLVRQADKLEQLKGARFRLRLLLVAKFEREGDVAQDRALLEQAEILENHANAAAKLKQLLSLERRDVLSVDHDTAARGPFEQVDAAYQRGLSGTGLADDAEDVPIFDGKVDIAKGGMGALAFAEGLR